MYIDIKNSFTKFKKCIKVLSNLSIFINKKNIKKRLLVPKLDHVKA